MAEKYSFGIDAGTPLIKSVIFNLASQEFGSGSQKVEIDSSGPTWMHQGMHAVWAATAVITKHTIVNAGINAADIGLACPTGNEDGAWMLDASRNPIVPSLPWNHRRAANIVA